MVETERFIKEWGKGDGGFVRGEFAGNAVGGDAGLGVRKFDDHWMWKNSGPLGGGARCGSSSGPWVGWRGVVGGRGEGGGREELF